MGCINMALQPYIGDARYGYGTGLGAGLGSYGVHGCDRMAARADTSYLGNSIYAGYDGDRGVTSNYGANNMDRVRSGYGGPGYPGLGRAFNYGGVYAGSGAGAGAYGFGAGGRYGYGYSGAASYSGGGPARYGYGYNF